MMYYIEKIFHRTAFKRKLFIALTVLLSFYILFFSDSSLMSHLKVRLLYIGNYSSNQAPYTHQIGQIVTNRNGSFMYFHLPCLSDFNIERDFYKLSSGGQQAANGSLPIKYCLKRGADLADIKADNLIVCVCKSQYSGNECAIPPLVQQTVDAKFTSQITRLRRPRRILLSLIWLTYDYSYANDTSKQIRLEQFSRAFESMAQFVDLFVVHEVRLVPDDSQVTLDQYSLEHQFNHGLLAKFKQYTLLYSNIVRFDLNSKLDIRKLESKLMRKSWKVFTSQITEYRPTDFLIFLSINNFPEEDLLLYLKYHAGLMDIIHLKPIRSSRVGHENGTIRAWSEVLDRADSSLNNFVSASESQSSELFSYHLTNVIISFEFISFLCRYKYESFVANYCLTDQHLLSRFQTNFWSVHLVTIGNEKLNQSSTFSIL